MDRRVFIETYGCQMNVADTELMFGLLRHEGFKVAETAEDADVVLLNTCAVRERAEERILGRREARAGVVASRAAQRAAAGADKERRRGGERRGGENHVRHLGGIGQENILHDQKIESFECVTGMRHVCMVW